jgi:hypothetical protein
MADNQDFEPDEIHRLALVVHFVLEFAAKNGVPMSDEQIAEVVDKFILYGDCMDDPAHKEGPAVGAQPVVANILWFVEQLGVPINETLHMILFEWVMTELYMRKPEPEPGQPAPPPRRPFRPRVITERPDKGAS